MTDRENLITVIIEQVNKCNDTELLYLILSLLSHSA